MTGLFGKSYQTLICPKENVYFQRVHSFQRGIKLDPTVVGVAPVNSGHVFPWIGATCVRPLCLEPLWGSNTKMDLLLGPIGFFDDERERLGIYRMNGHREQTQTCSLAERIATKHEVSRRGWTTSHTGGRRQLPPIKKDQANFSRPLWPIKRDALQHSLSSRPIVCLFSTFAYRYLSKGYHLLQNDYRYRSEIKSKTIGLYQITDVTDLYKIENNKSAKKLQTLQTLQF